jgi:3-hydroxyisobutyrate dehydrogenase-like beta-hydroxyacid dehydrogenase
MGSALGRAWQRGGADVVTTVADRSDRTRTLAAGLELLPGLPEVALAADIIVSIGPPAAALEMADDIAAACEIAERQPVVADLNAIAPATAHEIAAIVASAGCELIDGSISGGPPTPASATHLYLSGPSARRLADLPVPGVVTTVVGSELGSASAVKMSTAAVYKGFTALVLQSLQSAHDNGVLDVVVADLIEEFGGLLAGSAARIAMAAAKADRYVGEMREISITQGAAGARPELYEAMATVYASVAGTELARLTPEAAATVTDLAATLDQLKGPGRGTPRA